MLLSAARSLELFQECTYFTIIYWRKLLTHEDQSYFHIHKTIGVICLLNFFYRIPLWFMYRTMHFSGDYFTLSIIAVHFLLNATSFIFRLSPLRNRMIPMIWPEGRLHTMIFAYRSIFNMLLHWLYLRDPVSTLPYFWYVKGILVILTLASADYVTYYYKHKVKTVELKNSTMRSVPCPKWMSPKQKKVLKLYYSTTQLLATVSIIMGDKIDTCIFQLLPIQVAAFLLTLVKKSILTSTGWHFYYSMLLLIDWIFTFVSFSISDFVSIMIGIGLLSLARFYFGVNKYVLWTTVIGLQIVNEYYYRFLDHH